MQEDLDRARAEAVRAAADAAAATAAAAASAEMHAALAAEVAEAEAAVQTLVAVRDDADTLQRLTHAIADGERDLALEKSMLVGSGAAHNCIMSRWISTGG